MDTSDTNFKVHSTSSLIKQSDRDRANEILAKLVNATRPLLVRRQWRVKSLIEFYPKNPGLLGLNMNRGHKIMVRLRSAESASQFLDMESILGTFLHELVHNEISAHSFEFYSLLEKVEVEVQQDMLRMGWQSVHQISAKSPFSWAESKGQRLGGSANNSSSRSGNSSTAVSVFAKAGRKLGGGETAVETSGDRLIYHRSHAFGSSSSSGGDNNTKSGDPKDRREVILKATERRFGSVPSSSSSSSSSSRSSSSIATTTTRTKSTGDYSFGCQGESFSAEEMDLTLSSIEEIDLTAIPDVDFCPPCSKRRPLKKEELGIDEYVDLTVTEEDIKDEPIDRENPKKKARPVSPTLSFPSSSSITKVDEIIDLT